MTNYRVYFNYRGKEYFVDVESSLSIVDSSDRQCSMDLAENAVKEVIKQKGIRKEGAIPTDIRILNIEKNLIVDSFESFKQESYGKS